MILETGELFKRESNNSIVLQLEIDERWDDYNKYIEFETKENSWSYLLLDEETFEIPYDVSQYESVEMDIAFKKTEDGNTTQDFSEMKTIYFEPSINANPEEIQKHPDIIDELVGKVAADEEAISGLEAAKHTHNNKSILDNTTASYTTEEKTKLGGIETGAEVNKIESIKVNGTEQTINNKEVDINVPTKVSDLNNDSGFIDNTVNSLLNYYLKSETYTQAEVNALIGAITTLNILVVQTLPSQDISTNTIYFVPKNPAEQDNIYDEYIYVNNNWELIGTTAVNLEHYIQDTDFATSSKAGVFKVGNCVTVGVTSGVINAQTKTYNEYISMNNTNFISKGTLENVLIERIGTIETALNNLNTEAEAI